MVLGQPRHRVMRFVLLFAILALTWMIGTSGTGAHAASSPAVHPHLHSKMSARVIARVQPHASLNVCGTVTAYTPASATAAGSIVIGGQTLVIAPGATFTGSPITVNQDYCLAATIDVSGQITSANVTAGASASFSVCGTVTAFTAATASATGLLVIGGQTLVLAPGAALTGTPVTVGSNLCLQATTNGLGQVTSGTVTANASTTITVCGTVSAYAPATASAAGSITIGGQTIAIAPGATINGTSVTLGSPYCLNATTNATGQITSGTISANAPTSVTICGTVTAYTAATATAPGAITIGGQTYTIATGAAFSGNPITVGTSECISASVDASGSIVGGVVTASAPTNLTACGVVTAYTAATASAPGSITIAGETFVIAPGTTFTGQTITPGGSFCLYATLNPSGQITGGSVTTNAPVSLTVCGTITAYTAATAATAGSITIAGQTFTIAPGTTLVGSENLAVGATVTLNVMVDAPDTIVSGTVTVGCTVATATATATGTPATATATTTATATSTATTIATPPTGPPPPPTLTATVAPTDTPTVAPTNTPTATPVPTALGVFPKVVSSARIHHSGRLATVHWKMAYQLGLKGFRIFAGKKNLTSTMIKPHKSTKYTAHVAWVKHSRYSLHVLFKSGHQRTVTIH